MPHIIIETSKNILAKEAVKIAKEIQQIMEKIVEDEKNEYSVIVNEKNDHLVVGNITNEEKQVIKKRGRKPTKK